MSWIRENTLNWFQYLAVKILKTGHVPKHIAFIMDGNRRYAKKTNIEKLMGHTRGFDKLAETLQWCVDLGIPEVTVYAFSIENYKRSKEEVDGLMELARQKFQRLLDEREKLMEHGVRVRVIGNLSLVPKDICKLIAEALLVTENNNKAFLNIAFSYTSTDEITTSIKDILEGVKHNEILPEDINEDLISKCLYTHNSPDPDLLIRTSGEVRFSDFLMWQNSNSCIYFAGVLWPEFNVWDLLSAVFYYQRCYSDIQKLTGTNSTESVTHNARTSSYVNKLYNKRHDMYAKMRLQAVQS